MKKFYRVTCDKYRKFEKPKISYLLLVLSLICSKFKNEEEKYLKKTKIKLKC